MLGVKFILESTGCPWLTGTLTKRQLLYLFNCTLHNLQYVMVIHSKRNAPILGGQIRVEKVFRGWHYGVVGDNILVLRPQNTNGITSVNTLNT